MSGSTPGWRRSTKRRGRSVWPTERGLPYDILVLGTGTTPLMPGIPGEDLEGVFTLKKFTDALRIKAWLREVPCRKAIIVGAGFIGMEMSEAIRNLGIETQVFHRGTLPVNRWDPEFSQVVLEELRRHEVEFVTDVEDAGRGGGKGVPPPPGHEPRRGRGGHDPDGGRDPARHGAGATDGASARKDRGDPGQLLPADPPGGGLCRGRLLRNPSTG